MTGAPASGRSGKSGGGLADIITQNRGPLNGRLSQRKSNAGQIKGQGSNAVSAPHHQLGYRRHQIMDITEDSNTNSKNKLTLGSGHEETMNSYESERNIRGFGNHEGSDHNSGAPAYSLFYGNQPGSELATIGRFGSKKNI
jgi:hypothetical protein